MRALLASPSRDLLSCYKKLMDSDLCETLTAFDATQIGPLLRENEFDIAVIDAALPRIRESRAMEQIRQKGIPVVQLTGRAITADMLMVEKPVSECMPYPFFPGQMTEVCRRVLSQRSSEETLTVSGRSMALNAFSLPGGTAITASETRTLQKLLIGQPVGAEEGVYVFSLGQKLKRDGIPLSIHYQAKQGYGLVSGT